MTLSIIEPNQQAWKLKQQKLESTSYRSVGYLFDGLAVCSRVVTPTVSSPKKVQYGFLNSRGKEVVPCIYDWASNHYQGFAVVEKNSLYGFLNSKGEQITECEYDEVFLFGTPLVGGNKYYGVGRKQEEYFIIGRTGDAVGPLSKNGLSLLQSDLLKK